MSDIVQIEFDREKTFRDLAAMHHMMIEDIIDDLHGGGYSHSVYDEIYVFEHTCEAIFTGTLLQDLKQYVRMHEMDKYSESQLRTLSKYSRWWKERMRE